jgi:hemerythrin-like domain-containing protein
VEEQRLNAQFDGADPLQYFTACHAAIRARCSSLELLFNGDEDLASPAHMARIDGIVSFFEGPARAHHDEEEAVFFPRVRVLQLDDHRHVDLVSLIVSLEGDHRELDTLWRELRVCLRAAGDGFARDTRAMVATFVAIHRHHMNREDTGVLPIARRYLDGSALLEMGAAIIERQRRLASH